MGAPDEVIVVEEVDRPYSNIDAPWTPDELPLKFKKNNTSMRYTPITNAEIVLATENTGVEPVTVISAILIVLF